MSALQLAGPRAERRALAPASEWNPEEPGFWLAHARPVAYRNLTLSIPCLLCGFAVWMYWSVITVQMQSLGFPFGKEQLYTLSAVAGLAGATLRIPNSFLVAISGGRVVVAGTTLLLLLPALGTGLALRDPGTPYAAFVALAALSGFGGGAFASSMSNISFFFPKRMQGLALGLNAGLGNLGVSLMQVLLPWAMTSALFGALGGPGRPRPEALGGGLLWIQNAGLVWVPLLALLGLAAFALMNTLPMHAVGTSLGQAVAKMLWLLLLGLSAAALGLYLLLGLRLSMWLVLPVTVGTTLALLRFLTPGPVRARLQAQFVIFGQKHNWFMTWLYVMTFGSFIGFAAAFPKLIQDVFGTLPGGGLNPHAPDPLRYAWLGPLVGSLWRPVGGWLADRFGGARVTHWATLVMIAATLGVGYTVQTAAVAARPDEYFLPFLLLFLLLFVTTGLGNGSTFQMVPALFEPALAGPVLGWTSAVAAYGAFIVPQVFGAQIARGTPHLAFYGFAAYYLSCLALNWWMYARKNAECPC